MEESSVAMKIDTSATATGNPPGTDTVNQELLNKVRAQMEFYFSVENLQNDSFLVAQMDSNRSVAISEVMKFNKLKALTTDENVVTKSLEGSQICIVENGRVRSMKTTNRSTLMLRDIPSDAPEDEVKEIFNFPGQDSRPIVSLRGDIGDTWFVLFETEEGAKETLNELKARKITFRGNAVKGRVKSEAIGRSYYPIQSPTTAISPMGMPMYTGVPSPYSYPGGLPPMQMPFGFAGEGMDPGRQGNNMGKGAGGGDMKAPSPNNANSRKNNGGGNSTQNKGDRHKGNKEGNQRTNGSPNNFSNNNNNNNSSKSDNSGRQKDGNRKDKKDSKNSNGPAFNNNLADFPALDGAVSTSTQTTATVGSNSYINQIVNIAKPYMTEAEQAAASVATTTEKLQSVTVTGSVKDEKASGSTDSSSNSLGKSVWGNKTAVAAVQSPPVNPPQDKAVNGKVNVSVQATKPANVTTNVAETAPDGSKARSAATTTQSAAASTTPSVSPTASASASDSNAAPSKPPAPGSWAGIVSSGPMPDPNSVAKMAPKKIVTGSAPTSPGRQSPEEKKKDGKKDGGGKSDSPKKKKGSSDSVNSGGASASSAKKDEEPVQEVIESPSSWGGRPTFANVSIRTVLHIYCFACDCIISSWPVKILRLLSP